MLRDTRTRLTRASTARLGDIGRFDERIAAHLDGILTAGQAGLAACRAALENPGAGEVFTAAVVALETQDGIEMKRLFALVDAVPASARGILSAFGWARPAKLRGIVRHLLASNRPFQQQVGLFACAAHGADPGPALDAALGSGNAALRARALRTVGDCRRHDLLNACIDALDEPGADDENDACRFWAARSAALLAQHDRAADALMRMALAPGPMRPPALDFAMTLAMPARADELLQSLALDRDRSRDLICAMGMSGQARFAEQLLHILSDADNVSHARIAGESFSLITGLYLSADAARASATPPDEEANTDADFPLPDPEAVRRWWDRNASRFAPRQRFFSGAALSVKQCIQVIDSGVQRRRRLAAEHLRLLEPDTRHCDMRSPAWRQRRWLAQRGARA